MEASPVTEAGGWVSGEGAKKAPHCCVWRGEAPGCIAKPVFCMSEWE